MKRVLLIADSLRKKKTIVACFYECFFFKKKIFKKTILHELARRDSNLFCFFNKTIKITTRRFIFQIDSGK